MIVIVSTNTPPAGEQRLPIPPATGQLQSVQTRRARSSFKAVQLGFFVLIVAVVAAGLWSVVQQRPQSDSTIPKEVAGYRLQRSVEGSQALQMVAGLHQGSPQVTEAWVAYYERGGTVWAGTTASIDAAKAQLEDMAQAIGKGGTPFSDLREISLVGRRAFTVSDSTSVHYFFQGGTKVIWITPPGDSGLPFVEAAMRKF